jgi:hypothetical protein
VEPAGPSLRGLPTAYRPLTDSQVTLVANDNFTGYNANFCNSLENSLFDDMEQARLNPPKVKPGHTNKPDCWIESLDLPLHQTSEQSSVGGDDDDVLMMSLPFISDSLATRLSNGDYIKNGSSSYDLEEYFLETYNQRHFRFGSYLCEDMLHYEITLDWPQLWHEINNYGVPLYNSTLITKLANGLLDRFLPQTRGDRNITLSELYDRCLDLTFNSTICDYLTLLNENGYVEVEIEISSPALASFLDDIIAGTSSIEV